VPVLVLTIIGKYNAKVKKLTEPYWKMFKKAWYCVGRRVTFRACDSSFKDDIKNSVLSRLIIKHKKWVKPVSAAIEVAAVLIVVVAIWSLVEVGKAGLSLYVYGTCNVTQPEACILGENEVCSTEQQSDKNAFIGWFEEWGDLFTTLPARIKTWDASEYKPDNASYYKDVEGGPVALDIFDPGCINCLKSFNNQLEDGFFDRYNTYLVPYVIKSNEGEDGYRFANSRLIASYILATREFSAEKVLDSTHVMHSLTPEWYIVYRLFTEKDKELDIDYQSAFNGMKGLSGTPYSPKKAEDTLREWLKTWYSDETLDSITELAHSEKITEAIDTNRKLVDDTIQTKGIPTTIFDGKRHIGVYRP
jgi:hypothetical protein